MPVHRSVAESNLNSAVGSRFSSLFPFQSSYKKDCAGFECIYFASSSHTPSIKAALCLQRLHLSPLKLA